MDGAFRVTQGQVPFRDFFEVMGPGTYYLLALFFRVFGSHWWTTRLYLGVMGLASALLLYFLASRLNAGIQHLALIFLLAIATFPPQWPAISHHLDSNVMAFAALAAMLSWLDHRRPWMLLLTGFLAAATACFVMPKGICLLLAFIMLVGILGRKHGQAGVSLVLLGTGVCAAALCVALYFLRFGALGDLYFDLLRWPLTHYSGVNAVPYGHFFKEVYSNWAGSLSGFPSAISWSLATLLAIPLMFTLALPLILGLLTLRFGFKAFTPTTWPYWLTGSALWVSEMHREDLFHVLWGSPVLVILAFYLLKTESARIAQPAVLVVVFSAILLNLFDAMVCWSAQTKIVTPRGTVQAFRQDAILAFTNAHVKPGDDTFFYPWSPNYYFLSGANNPTRFSILQYQANTDEQFREVVEQLDEKKVRYVVWDTGFSARARLIFPKYRPPPPDRLIVEPFLTQHYRVIGENGNFRFLERK